MSAGLASAPPHQCRCVCVRDGQLLGSSAGRWKRPPTASTSLSLRVLSGRVTSWSLAGQSDVILPPRRRLGARADGRLRFPRGGSRCRGFVSCICLLSGRTTLHPGGGKHRGPERPTGTERPPGHAGALRPDRDPAPRVSADPGAGGQAPPPARAPAPRGKKAAGPAGRGQPWLRRRDGQY